jgi:HSP20 family molecular chaperone IbpA
MTLRLYNFLSPDHFFDTEEDLLYSNLMPKVPDVSGKKKKKGTTLAPTTFENRDNKMVITIDTRPFKEKDIKVATDHGYLVVEAESAEDKNDNDVSYHCKHSLHHSFKLPEGIPEDKVQAFLRKGKLEIKIEGAPPHQKHPGPKKIEIEKRGPSSSSPSVPSTEQPTGDPPRPSSGSAELSKNGDPDKNVYLN